MSSEEETPRGLIQGFLLNNEINESTVHPRSQRRRSSRRISLLKFNNDSKRSDVTGDVDSDRIQANTRRSSLNAGKLPSNRMTHSTPKHSTPEVSARIAARNRFLHSKKRTEGLQSASKYMTEEEPDEPTTRLLIRGFLNNADPETPAVHRLESPPTENFLLPGIYNDEVISVQKGRPMSPLVDVEVSVGSSGHHSVKKRKRKRQELSYENFFSGIEKRMKTAGPRIEEDAAADLENDTSTLEERAETEVILSSSPDGSGTHHSRIHLQSGIDIPDFQIGDAEDDESISGDESLDGNIQGAVEENVAEVIDNDGEEVRLSADEPDEIIGSDKLKGSHTEVAPRFHIGEDRFLSEDELKDPEVARDGKRKGEDIARDSESEDQDVPEGEQEDGSSVEETETQHNTQAVRDGRSQEEDVSRDLEDQDVPDEEPVDGSFQPSNIQSRGFTDVDTNLEGLTLSYDSNFQKLKTPHISPRAYKTPVLTERKQRQRVQVSKSVPAIHKTTRKARSQRKKSQPPLPTSLTKSIFSHFSAAKVSKEAIAAVERESEQFFKRLTADLGAYCKHSHRQTIEISDVELLMKRQKLITSKKSLESLIEQHLPLEYRRELIPVAYAGNVVKPKM